MISIKRDIVSSQSKGCLLFLQLGTSALIVRTPWRSKADVAMVHAEIDTPMERLRVNFYAPTISGKRKRLGRLALKSDRDGSSYRGRWLRKMGYPA